MEDVGIKTVWNSMTHKTSMTIWLASKELIEVEEQEAIFIFWHKTNIAQDNKNILTTQTKDHTVVDLFKHLEGKKSEKSCSFS